MSWARGGFRPLDAGGDAAARRPYQFGRDRFHPVPKLGPCDVGRRDVLRWTMRNGGKLGTTWKSSLPAFFLHRVASVVHCWAVELAIEEIRAAVQAALIEDVGPGDATTAATVPAQARATAVMAARESLVLCGIAFAEETFRSLAPDAAIECCCSDGDRVGAGEKILRIAGPAAGILTAERVALNFVQRLSGVATLAAQFVKAVSGTRAKILDTRKTTPGWRRLEKYAVQCGGGVNHRFGLWDRILIKDNHLAALRNELPNAIAAAVRRAREKFPQLLVEVEADTLEQVGQAAAAGADIILLDNMSVAELKESVRIIAGRSRTEASGGVHLSTVHGVAATGVDFISVGALTHSARAVDIGLDFEADAP